MRKNKKRFFLVAGVCLVLAAGYGFYLYQKPRSGVENIKADIKIAATDLYNHFSTNEAEANTRYLNKVLLVEGTIADDVVNKQKPIILLYGGPMGNINCEIMNVDAGLLKQLKKGNQVVIKGRCAGFLADVNLVDCVVK